MQVLFVASECHPFIKTGGLGDVAYALPKALRRLGIDVRVILPKYGVIPEAYKDSMTNISKFTVKVGWRNQYCGLQFIEKDGIPFYFIDNEYYFKRPEPYGYYDDGEVFSYFSRAVLEAIPYMKEFSPSIIHCNDWHSGIIPVLLKEHYKDNSSYVGIKTVFTIHNLQYQGVYGKEVLNDLLDLDEGYFDEEKLKFYDGVSFMKGGINFSDFVTTVSNSYAEEIKTSSYGEGLNGLLSAKSDKLTGIVNGIDYEIFNPKCDKNIWFNYDENNFEDKVKNKLELQSMLHLPVNRDIPMMGMVSRLVDQKGIDLITCVLEEILELDIQFVVLGTGEKRYEELFKTFAKKYPEKLSANIFFNNSLAQRIYAASDMFLMPSRFEPCGIGQLLALRYGSIPIVRETGGLKDTVKSYNEDTGEGNGFSFSNYNANEMFYALERAVKNYKDNELWSSIVESAMVENHSWEESAKEYCKLYGNL